MIFQLECKLKIILKICPRFSACSGAMKMLGDLKLRSNCLKGLDIFIIIIIRG